MTAEQLANARAAAWRQDGRALLTGEDAAQWLQETGLALFLPAGRQLAAPAPSFVEATLGRSEATPEAAAIGNANHLLLRLLQEQDLLALNLAGTPGDRPDFLATAETFPFVFALRGDREWERGPRGRSSPLTVEVWKLLDREGALTTGEITDQLGRQITEAATLRALADLWTNLRIEPVYTEDAGTRWQRLEVNHARAMKAGSAMGQATALSGLVSLYLQSAVAATADEMEAFLSPLASRSRVRDAVRGLTAMRQLEVRNLGAKEHFLIDGTLAGMAAAGETQAGLPDLLPEIDEPADFATAEGFGLHIEELGYEPAAPERRRSEPGPGRQRFVAERAQKSIPEKRSFTPRTTRPGSGRPERTGRPERSERPERSTRPGSERKPFTPREGAEKKPFFAREPWKEDARKPFPRRDSGEGQPRERRADTYDKPARTPSRLFDRPRAGTSGRDERPAPRSRSMEDRPRFNERRAAGSTDRKPYPAKSFGRKPFGEKPFGTKPSGEKPFGTKPSGEKPFGRKPFDRQIPAGDGGVRPPRRGFAPREDQAPRPERRSFTRPEGGAAPTERRSFSRSAKPSFDRPKPGGRPYPQRERGEGAPRPGPKRSFGAADRASGAGSDRPRAPRPAAGRPFTSRGPKSGSSSRGGARPYPPRDGAKRSFTPREGDFNPGRSGGEAARPAAPRRTGSFAKPTARGAASGPVARRSSSAPGTRGAGTKNFGTKGLGTKGPGAKSPGAKGFGTKSAGAKPFGARRSGPGAKSFGRPKPGGAKGGPRSGGSAGRGPKGSGPRRSGPRA